MQGEVAQVSQLILGHTVALYTLKGSLHFIKQMKQARGSRKSRALVPTELGTSCVSKLR